jgi:hypothetical protein
MALVGIYGGRFTVGGAQNSPRPELGDLSQVQAAWELRLVISPNARVLDDRSHCRDRQ